MWIGRCISRVRGGVDAMTSYIQERMVYPKEAIANKETARVFVEFVVDKSGSVKTCNWKGKEKNILMMKQ